MAGPITPLVPRRSVLAGGAALAAAGALGLAGAPDALAAPARSGAAAGRRRAGTAAQTAPLELGPVVEAAPGRSFEQHLISRATFGWTPELEREVKGLG